MTLHFAYGANMSRAVMRCHAPDACALGVAELPDYRFVITADGYGSVEPAKAERVLGVLWRITAGDRVTLDAWENVEGGLYRAGMRSVQGANGRRIALVYLARPRRHGRPKPGYIDLVVGAAREWDLDDNYIASLQRWACPFGTDARKIGEFL